MFLGYGSLSPSSLETGNSSQMHKDSETTTELDILILAPVPPPFGGVGVHVNRLVPLLQSAGLRVGVLNHFSSMEASFVVGVLKRNPLNYFRMPKKVPARVVHYHHSHWGTLMAVAIGKGRRTSKYIITLHSGGLRKQLSSKVPLLKPLTQWALNRFDVIIVVNQEIRAIIENHVEARRIEVVPAFLRAVHDEPQYDAATDAFLASGRTMLVPAYRLRIRDGYDSYGLDTAVEAFMTLAEERPELRLAFFIAQRPSGRKAIQYISNLENRLEQAGLTDRVLSVFERPLISAFRHDVIVLRPTRTDGDALSVREALEVGVPVIASDAVERPAGTVTFCREDVVDLCAAVRQVLDEPSVTRRQDPTREADEHSAEPFLARLMRIYLADVDCVQTKLQ